MLTYYDIASELIEATGLTPLDINCCDPLQKTIGAGSFQWQNKAWEEIDDSKHLFLKAPTGSGKSALMCALVARDIKANLHKKAIISTSQIISSKGFAESTVLHCPDNLELPWIINHTCNLTSKDGKISNNSIKQYFLDFLTGTFTQEHDKVLLCTHAALISIYKYLTENNLLNLFEDCLIVIDEAHHSKGTLLDNEQDIDMNCLGDLIHTVLNSKNTRVILATATPMRGDGISMLLEDVCDNFQHWEYARREYLQAANINNLHYKIAFGEADYAKAIVEILNNEEEFGTPIVFIESVNCARHKIDGVPFKIYQTQQIITALRDVDTPITYCETTGTLTITHKGKSLTILDFVTSKDRSKKRKYYNNIKAGERGPDLVISLNIGIEGADYPMIDKVLFVGQGNVTLNLQKIGRALRAIEKPKSVKIWQIMPLSLDYYKDDFYGNSRKVFETMISAILGMGYVCPVLPVSKAMDKNAQPQNPLEELAVSYDTQCQIFQYLSLATLPHVNKAKRTKKENQECYEALLENCRTALKYLKLDENLCESVVKYWWQLLNRKLRNYNGYYGNGGFMDVIVHNQNELCAIFTEKGLQDFKTYNGINAQENKRLLIELAKSGADRPGQKISALGSALSIYTNIGCHAYDAEFNALIRKLAPHWFIENLTPERAMSMLINMVRDPKCSKPKYPTKMARWLKAFTNKSSKYFNETVCQEIYAIRPEWKSKNDRRSDDQKFLIKYISDDQKFLIKYINENIGAKRPRADTKEGKLLMAYLFKSKEIKELVNTVNPHWLAKNKLDILMNEIINLKEKPTCKSNNSKYQAMNRLIKKHPEFKKEMYKKHPDWFVAVDIIEQNKNKLDQMTDKPKKGTKEYTMWHNLKHKIKDLHWLENHKQTHSHWYKKHNKVNKNAQAA